ncbi:MAG: N-6 DNA methylase, partial [Candidatus Heimdallarchaeota archaeon]
YQMGEIYQELLRLCHQQQTLCAYYTPCETVDYMVSKLELSPFSTVLDPACGSGHFIEACIAQIKERLLAVGDNEINAAQRAISQVWGNDIDPFAVLLSTIRITFLGDGEQIRKRTTIKNTDILKLPVFNGVIESSCFDYIIGNPPYGKRISPEDKKLYQKIYRDQASVFGYKISGNDLYGYFLANAIRGVKNRGRICFLISDTFLSLRSHTTLRRLILDTCMINEIVLAPINLFRPINVSRTCIMTLTKHLCEHGYNRKGSEWKNKSNCICAACQDRRKNQIRLVDRLQSESEYLNPTTVQFIQQEEYEHIMGNPFWINVPRKFVQIMQMQEIQNGWKYEELRTHIDGGEGISTGDNHSHVAVIRGSHLWEKLQGGKKIKKYRIYNPEKIINLSAVDEKTLDDYRFNGIPGYQFLVPFVKGSSCQYWGDEGWFIDWSTHSVGQIKDRAYRSRGRKAVFRNPRLYFKRGLITDAHHGILKASLVEYSIPAGNTNLLIGLDIETEFLLGFLNSKVASYFLGKLINTSFGGMSGHATPEDIKRLPVCLPTNEKTSREFHLIKYHVIQKVTDIIALLKKAPEADYSVIQHQIDTLIFKWFSFNEAEKKVIDNYLNQMDEEKSRY